MKIKRNLVVVISIIFALIATLVPLKLKETQVKSYSINDNTEEMEILEKLVRKDLIRKNNGNYELLKYKELDYDKVGEIKDLSIPSRYKRNLEMPDYIMKNTYKDVTTAEQILINYLALSYGMPTFEDTDTLNEKLKSYNKELDYLENNSYLKKVETVLLTLAVNFVASLFFILFLIYIEEHTGFEIYYPDSAFSLQLFITVVDTLAVAFAPLLLYYVISVCLFILRILLNSMAIGGNVSCLAQYLIARDFEDVLE